VKVKTAISIDDLLLEEATSIAMEMDVPKSRVVSLALEEYIQRYRNRQLFHQINEAYTNGPDEDEAGTSEIMRSHRRKLDYGDRDVWK
jgi:metal-responsive CopG/Arc/MetJ family transcriptional regulator